jgi:hypothetical protein
MAYNKIKSTINFLDTPPAKVLAKNLFIIRKTNGRIEQTMKIENARVNTKVLVATRAKRG